MKAYLTEAEKIVASNLRIARKIRGYTLSDVSKVLKVSAQQVQKYETGNSKIPFGKLLEVAEYFKVDIKFFIKKFEI